MFCQNCGNSITENLKYCNRCGFRVSGDIERQEKPLIIQPSKPTGIIAALSIVTGVIVLSGLGILFPLLILLLKTHVDPSAVIVITLMVLATLFGISWLMIRQISRALDGYLKGENMTVTNQTSSNFFPQKPAQLFNRNTGQIEAPSEPFVSVTENTTKFFDKIPQERKFNG